MVNFILYVFYHNKKIFLKASLMTFTLLSVKANKVPHQCFSSPSGHLSPLGSFKLYICLCYPYQLGFNWSRVRPRQNLVPVQHHFLLPSPPSLQVHWPLSTLPPQASHVPHVPFLLFHSSFSRHSISIC